MNKSKRYDSDSEKKMIGALIGYYHKKKKMTIKRVITTKNGKRICDPKTLTLIENGNVSRDHFYYDLAENMDLKITLNQNIYKYIYGIRDRIIENISSFSASKLKQEVSIIDEAIIKYSNHLYIKELLMLYKDIISFLLYKTYPSKSNIDIYLFISSKLDTKNKMIDLFFLIAVSKYYEEVSLIKDDLYDKARLFINTPMFFSIKLDMIVDDDKLDEAYPFLTNLLNAEYELNDYQRYLVYNNVAFALCNMNLFGLSLEYLKRCELLVDNNLDISESKKIDLLKQSAMIHYMNNDYINSIHYFKLAKSFPDCKLGTSVIFFFDSFEKLKKTDKLKDILLKTNINNIINKREKKIVIFYKEKYKSEPLNRKTMIFLEDYILDILVDVACSGGNFIKKIVFDNLSYLTSNTKNYSKLNRFKNACDM